MKILIVEDDPKNASFLSRGLAENGITFDVAGRGDEGLGMARTAAYDLVILDVMLPRVDGSTILAAIRETGRETPVLYLTARDGVEDRVRGLELGTDDYLAKPFAFAELLARVRSVLRRSPARQPDTVRVADLELDARRGGHAAVCAG
ncbi:MAG: czcR 2 [Gemmataceae bacterium]|nr:czcR 2 [Gemmataceae bacterium]